MQESESITFHHLQVAICCASVTPRWCNVDEEWICMHGKDDIHPSCMRAHPVSIEWNLNQFHARLCHDYRPLRFLYRCNIYHTHFRGRMWMCPAILILSHQHAWPVTILIACTGTRQFVMVSMKAVLILAVAVFAATVTAQDVALLPDAMASTLVKLVPGKLGLSKLLVAPPACTMTALIQPGDTFESIMWVASRIPAEHTSPSDICFHIHSCTLDPALLMAQPTVHLDSYFWRDLSSQQRDLTTVMIAGLHSMWMQAGCWHWILEWGARLWHRDRPFASVAMAPRATLNLTQMVVAHMSASLHHWCDSVELLSFMLTSNVDCLW